MKGVHDMGGARGFGRVAVEADEPVYHDQWEGRLHGMQRQLTRAGLFNVDEFRHAQERLPAAQYLASGYYERWLAAIEVLVTETDATVREETLPETSAAVRFMPGDGVVTRDADVPGHTRLPSYAQGRRGTVESVHGPSKLPDTNAHHLSLDWEPVYTVRFAARELWGEAASPADEVSIDLWQSYLEAEA
jgi:hypothetical protein